MTRRQLRIQVDGRIDDHTARALGAANEEGEHGHELVFEYVDQAHVTGILVRLSDLHISYSRVEIDAAGAG